MRLAVGFGFHGDNHAIMRPEMITDLEGRVTIPAKRPFSEKHCFVEGLALHYSDVRI
jgi:hypothetical protein